MQETKEYPEVKDILAQKGGYDQAAAFEQLKKRDEVRKEQYSPIFQEAMQEGIPADAFADPRLMATPIRKALAGATDKALADADRYVRITKQVRDSLTPEEEKAFNQYIFDMSSNEGAVGSDVQREIAAKQKALESGISPDRWKTISKVYNTQLTPMEKYHYAKQVISDQIDRSSSNDEIRSLMASKNAIDDVLNRSPTYKKATSLWSDSLSGDNAVELGRRFFKEKDPVKYNAIIADMSPADIESAKAGMMSEAANLAGGKDPGSLAGKLLEGGNQQKFRALYGKDADAVMAALKQNAAKWDRFETTRNALSSPKGVSTISPAEKTADIVTDVATHGSRAPAKWGWSVLSGRALSPEAQRIVGQKLTEPNLTPSQVTDLMTKQPKQYYRTYFTPAASGALADLMRQQK